MKILRFVPVTVPSFPSVSGTPDRITDFGFWTDGHLEFASVNGLPVADDGTPISGRLAEQVFEMYQEQLFMCEVCEEEFTRAEVVKVQGVYVCADHYDPSDGEPEEEESTKGEV